MLRCETGSKEPQPQETRFVTLNHSRASGEVGEEAPPGRGAPALSRKRAAAARGGEEDEELPTTKRGRRPRDAKSASAAAKSSATAA